MTPAATIKRVMRSRTPEDLFGPLEAVTLDERLEALHRQFIDMSKVLHPDRVRDSGAAEAMARLTELRNQARDRLQANDYGKPSPVTIKAGHLYEEVQPLADGDLCDVYSGVVRQSKPKPVVLKVVRAPKNADLMDAEARTLKHLWDPAREHGDHFTKYLPRLIETTTLAVRGQKRRTNILGRHVKRVPLQMVIDAYPNGVDPRDMAWMFRRTLEILTWVHRQGVIHGAVTPAHLLLNTENHSIRLIDWCYSARRGQKIPAMPMQYEGYYPMEVRMGQPAMPTVDIYMAAAIAEKLLRGTPGLMMPSTVPLAIVRLLSLCQQPAPQARYQDAWEVYQEFDTILRKLYGKPLFRKFTIPT
jgi:serine/threonine protein kinase